MDRHRKYASGGHLQGWKGRGEVAYDIAMCINVPDINTEKGRPSSRIIPVTVVVITCYARFPLFYYPVENVVENQIADRSLENQLLTCLTPAFFSSHVCHMTLKRDLFFATFRMKTTSSRHALRYSLHVTVAPDQQEEKQQRLHVSDSLSTTMSERRDGNFFFKRAIYLYQL